MVLVRGATVALITSCVLLSSCGGNRPFGPTVGEVFSGVGSARAAAEAQTGLEDRPDLLEMLAQARPGDTVTITAT